MWGEVVKLVASDAVIGTNLGSSVAVAGDIIVAGGGHEAAYVFERDQGGPGLWGEIVKLTASDDDGTDNVFGAAVAVSGRTVVVGAPNDNDAGFAAGAAYVFVRVEPLLSFTGSCPGAVELAVSGATPAWPLVLVGSTSEGSTTVPGGPCAGTELDLFEPTLLSVILADGNGDLSITLALGKPACGLFLQAVDGFTCVPSNVAALSALSE